MSYQTEANEENFPVCLVLTVGELERLVNAADCTIAQKSFCEDLQCKCCFEYQTESDSDQCKERQEEEVDQLTVARNKIVSWVREAIKRQWMIQAYEDKTDVWTCKVHDAVTGEPCGTVNKHRMRDGKAICSRCKFTKYVSDCAGAIG